MDQGRTSRFIRGLCCHVQLESLRYCPGVAGVWWQLMGCGWGSAEAGEETDTGPHTPANLGPGDRQAATHPPLWALRWFDHFNINITKHRFHNLCRLLFFHKDPRNLPWILIFPNCNFWMRETVFIRLLQIVFIKAKALVNGRHLL